MGIKRILKWIGLGLCALAGVVLVAAAWIHLYIGSHLTTRFDVAGEWVTVPTDPEGIAEGQRLAQLRGCSGGCHGREVQGAVFFEVFDGTRMIAPDLARLVRDRDMRSIERSIRHGVRPDGTSVIRAMPSEMLSHLSDEDLGKIIAYLRSQAPGTGSFPETRFRPLGRIALLLFKRQIETLIAAEIIDHRAEHTTRNPVERNALGRYLAMSVCTECHGADLRGSPDGQVPGLVAAVAYSPAEFEALMRTGKPIGNRELGLMARVARSRFVRFTDEEIRALHGYLQDAMTRPVEDS